MKQVSYLLTAVIFTGIIWLSSCTKKSDPEPVDMTPSISFVAGTGYVSSDVTLKINSTFKVGIVAASNSNSKSPLTKFSITRIINNNSVKLDTIINRNDLNLNVMAQAYSLAGQEKWYFKITDMGNYSKEISFTVTTTATKSSEPLNFIAPGKDDLLVSHAICTFAPAEW